MKAVIFAGGVGTRLWPLSRKKTPKQFEGIIDDKSTLRLQFELLLKKLNADDVFISTGEEYRDIVGSQLPEIPKGNIITEPYRKDVGPAVALVMAHLTHLFPEEPVIILWSDHLIKKQDEFISVLDTAEKVISDEPNKIIFIGHKPRFASENLGWIEYGKSVKSEGGKDLHAFTGFKYKPNKEEATAFFESGHHAWNLGYWVTTPKFMDSLYKELTPDIHEHTEAIMAAYGTDSYERTLREHYIQIPAIHFDHAIVYKIDHSVAYVMIVEIGWTDIGAWEQLKEALEERREDNVTFGNVLLENCSDSLVYNYDDKKLVVTMDLDDFVVVNTDDVILVTRKGSVPKISGLVKSLEGTKHESLT